jgi:hypothetical protein
VNYTVEMGSISKKNIPSIMKIGSDKQTNKFRDF